MTLVDDEYVTIFIDLDRKQKAGHLRYPRQGQGLFGPVPPLPA
ncbi:hypothetical protein DFAR_1930002 [Desulfarculales bacterium]